MRSADGFLKRLAEHISGQTDPVAAVVERVAFAAETLAGDRQIQHLLTKRQQGGTIVSLTSDVALAFGRSMLHRLDIDWERHGFDDAALDELAGLSLRTLHSILIDPGRPLRDAITLCRFVARWLGPAIVYPRLAQAMDALQPTAKPSIRGRPSVPALAPVSRRLDERRCDLGHFASCGHPAFAHRSFIPTPDPSNDAHVY